MSASPRAKTINRVRLCSDQMSTHRPFANATKEAREIFINGRNTNDDGDENFKNRMLAELQDFSPEFFRELFGIHDLNDERFILPSLRNYNDELKGTST
jgi:hypothetical protein